MEGADIYLTLGVATAQRGVDEDEQDGEGDAREGEEDAVELEHQKAEGGDEDYSHICCFSFTLETLNTKGWQWFNKFKWCFLDKSKTGQHYLCVCKVVKGSKNWKAKVFIGRVQKQEK